MIIHLGYDNFVGVFLLQMQDKLMQMVHKDFILLTFGFLQLGYIVLVKLPLDLMKELQAFNPVFGNCHTRCEVRRKSVLHYDWSWMSDFTISIIT